MNPADNQKLVKYNRQAADDIPGLAGLVGLMRGIIFPAKIKKANEYDPDKQDYVWTVDIYAQGYSSQATALDIPARPETPQDNFAKDSQVEIKFDEENIAIIQHPAPPNGQGRYKVLMLIDDNNPGTKVFDYPRFSV